jgi:hypothetical protein
MTAPHHGPGWRRVAVMACRALLSAAFLIVVYYQAPLDLDLDATLLVWLVLGLLGLALALAWQLRAIMASESPRLQAAQAIAVGLPFLLTLYASVYWVFSLDDPASFTQHLSRTDALYFTMTVFSTVGFGDITPVSQAARIVVMTQMVMGLIAVGVVAKLLFGAVQVAEGRRAAGGEDRSIPPARDP